MAKQNANQINKIQAPIAENHRDRMRLSDDGKTLFVTIPMPRYENILIRKTETVKMDHAKTTPEQHAESHRYGTGRRCRDGAETKDSEGNTLDAKTDAGKAALLVNARAHCAMRIEVMQGVRAARATKSGVNTVTREVLKLCKQFIVRNIDDDTGARYTAKTLPSSLLNCKTLEEAQAEAKRIGVPPKKLIALVKRGTGIAALIDDDLDMSI